MSSKLIKYLNEHRAKKGETYTHTSMGGITAGSFNIPFSDNDKLVELIVDSYLEGNYPSLTEKQLNEKPMTIDIDLRYDFTDEVRRYHNQTIVRDIIDIYNNAIRKYVEIPQEFQLESYILERSSPYLDKGKVKDGLHILYPDVVISTDIQHMIRDEVIRKSYKIMMKLPIINNLEDVFDRAVIDKNPWTIFGCTKPNRDPYLLKHIFKETYDSDLHEYNLKRIPIRNKYTESRESQIELTKRLLTRREFTEEDVFKVREAYRQSMENMNNLNIDSLDIGQTVKIADHIQNNKPNSIPNSAQDREAKLAEIEEAKELVKILSPERASNYRKWMEVGWCLYCISPLMLDEWIEFSKQCPEKYKEGECEIIWKKMENRGVSIRSLHRWARIDNPERYRLKRSEQLSEYLHKSITGLSQDIAEVVYQMYKHQYVCVDGKKNWYEFYGHRWRPCPNAVELQQKIGREVLDEYLYLIARYNQIAIGCEEEQRNKNLLTAKQLTTVTCKIREITTKRKIMDEAATMFYDRDFAEKLDQNPYLIGFNNGIYDLRHYEFRDGRPEDMVSVSTENDYIEYPDDHPYLDEVTDFMTKIFPDEDLRRYVWDFFASCLDGTKNRERFHIGTGEGGNGKSKLINLFHKTFRGYVTNIPVSLLTNKRPEANKPQAELMALYNKRFGYMQEPNNDEIINAGLMKELSGNDEITCRPPFGKQQITFKPQIELMLLCNDKPKLDADDLAVWRRIKVIPFKARFVENPNPERKYEHAIDDNLDEKLERWKEPFMYMLLKHYPIYKKCGLFEPDAVREATNAYQMDSDLYMEFIHESLSENQNGFLNLTDSYEAFKKWFEASHGKRPPNKRIFKNKMTNKLKTKLKYGKGWEGWSFKESEKDPNMIENEII